MKNVETFLKRLYDKRINEGLFILQNFRILPVR